MSNDSTIISVSMKPEDIAVLEAIKDATGIRSRSEIIRKSLQSMNAEYDRAGEEGVLVVVHDESNGKELLEVQHMFPKTITSHLHQCKDKYCVETYNVSGESAPALFKALQGVTGVIVVKAVWI